MPSDENKLFRAAVVTPESQLLETDVLTVQFPAHDGMVGILTHRAPLLTKLGTGILILDGPKGTQRFVISGGYAQMKDNVLTILTDEALPAEQVTPATLAAEHARTADAKLDATRRERAKQRATAMEHLLNHA